MPKPPTMSHGRSEGLGRRLWDAAFGSGPGAGSSAPVSAARGSAVGTDPTRDLVISLTNRSRPRHIENMRRRQRELSPVADHVVAMHGDPAAYRASGLPVLVLDDERITAALAHRVAAYGARATLVPGNGDLLFLDICRQLSQLSFRHVWLLEDDVDWAGSWADFLAIFAGFDGDLLGTNLRTFDADPDWCWWAHFAPPGIPRAAWLAGFYPTRRLSRACIDLLLGTDHAAWQGHFECAWPTAARAAGLIVRDLNEAPVPIYRNVNAGDFAPGTYVYRPVLAHGYFHETPTRFAQRNLLYHPIKVQ